MTQEVLAGKIGLVFGVANKRSIAWAIAKAWAAAGAKLIFNYQGERLKENVEELASEFGENTPLFPCDVSSDEEIKTFFEKMKSRTQTLDLMLHSVAYAPKEALEGDFVSTTREPLKRSCDPAELGDTGVFLASDGAAAITGQVIYVDGGYQVMGM